MSDFIPNAVLLLWVKLCHGILLTNVWRAGLKAVYKKVHLVKFRAKGSSIFFEYEGTSCYATTVYKILCGTYLAANITNLYTISGLC